jgi:hypothetical protein
MRVFSKNPDNVYASVSKALAPLTPSCLCDRAFEHMKKTRSHDYFYQWWCERLVEYASYQIWNSSNNDKECARLKAAFLKKFA